MPIEHNEIQRMAAFYRRHLLQDVVSFWESRTADPEGPGYLVSFDRRGELTGTDKNLWCQGRQTYLFSALCQHIEAKPEWLALAKRGRDLLATLGEAGDGRWPYLLNREGGVLNDSPSILTDAFALMGLCQYATATGSEKDRPLIERAFERYETHVLTPGFNEYHHFQFDPSCLWLGGRMVTLGLAEQLRPVLGEERIRPLLDSALHDILYRFARDDQRLLYEVLDAEGNLLPTPLGRRLNPGHALECMWFCFEEGLARGDRSLVERAGRIMHWTWENGYDAEFGGLLAFTTPEGEPAPLPSGQKANRFRGETSDTKVWWVHSEALYATALAAIHLDDAAMWQHFLHLHEYTQKHFADAEFGEWYTYLNRDGSPRDTDKGNWIRCAFHVPRNLLKLTLLFERYAHS